MRHLLFLGVVLAAAHSNAEQVKPRHEDCLSYNPLTLKITYQEMMDAWQLSDGHSSMEMFGTEQDAKNGLALASRYSQQCFIGRHASTHPNGNRGRHFVRYWKDSTGKQTSISPETCQAYVRSDLHAEDKGEVGWIVRDGKAFQLSVDNGEDADAVIALARQYTSHCTIGPADPPRPLQRVDYWK